MFKGSEVNESARIGNSCYNQKWLIETLEAKDETFCSRHKESCIVNISFEEIGSGKGFLSNVYKVTIGFADKKEPFLAAIKIPNGDVFVNAADDIGGGASEEDFSLVEQQNRECDFYDRFGNLRILPLPKIYAVERPGENGEGGVILMEYLMERGTMVDVFESVRPEQLRNLTKIFAKIATYSLSLPDEDVEQYRLPSNFVEVIGKLCVEAGPKAVAMYPSDLRNLYKRIEHIFVKPYYFEYALTATNKQLGIRPVLVHGDCWVNNIFWKKDMNGGCSNDIYALIDWQLFHAGTVGHDLSLILAWCSDQQIRREAEKWIFTLFHDYIQDELRGSTAAVPFSPKQIEASYRRVFVFQAIWFFCFARSFLTTTVAEEKKRRLLSRIKYAMEDAISILEEDLPEFLDPSFVPSFNRNSI